MENITITALLIQMFFWMVKFKKALKFLVKFHDSKAGQYFFKTFAIGGFMSFTVINLLTSNLIWLKYELCVKGLWISSATFLILTCLIIPCFYLIFKDLFFPKNNNNQKPFSIV
ncbi:hypothetical protein D0809_24070 [Flavobacterium circumlabens]|uniref:Uncharacterized protein n=1 Tax=Flavobacterium circumlabens TaxID=2133765 RepID=A0A4Y7U7F7_9FLAO|nr:hypothetical protein [Flavobacterium circumlabens]TCN50006.1 hypothetical protein EV142_1183 [Flavobacterium circumlabens]TEB41722.1 hypothetical protein D0809_24070 [Flavobacterium circumlabens]